MKPALAALLFVALSPIASATALGTPVATVAAKPGEPAEVASDTFLDEDRRPWRYEMRRRFAPLIKDCKTRREAILLIAQNAAQVCGVKYSTGRRAPNQSVAESLESGKASCTGLSILLAAAYRSVGIPARIAGVAEWGDRPGNHTWVEVLDHDRWHFIEYYTDKAGLDRGWILDPILNLDPKNPRSRVLARDDSGDDFFFLPWNPEDKSLRAVDRTQAYLRIAAAQGLKPKAVASASSGTLVFEAKDASGQRVSLAFRVLDGEHEVFSGKTPGPLDDLNNAPRAALPAGREHAAVYRDKSGKACRVRLTPKAGETTTVNLPAE